MSSLDAKNLYVIIDKCRGFLRDDYIEAMEAAAAEISRLQEVVKKCHKEIRELKRVNA